MEKAPRFDRKPEAIGSLRIQARDLEIIGLVWEYRFLNSEQIQALVDGSDQVILRRLQKLYHHGYLDRPISQIVFSNPLFGPQKMVYGLGDKGADLLVEEYGRDRGKIVWREKNKEVKEQYIQHTLMISEFRACLTLALKDNPVVKELLWLREDTKELKQDVYFLEEGRKRRLTIVPDGFFLIERPQGKKDAFFFEADRSTMTNARFLNKMRAYWLWHKQGGHHKLSIDSFRVLTLTTTKRRMDNLIDVAKQADDRQVGSNMFWFAMTDDIQLNNPRRILESIWRTPADRRKPDEITRTLSLLE